MKAILIIATLIIFLVNYSFSQNPSIEEIKRELKNLNSSEQIDYLIEVPFDVLTSNSAEMEKLLLSGIKSAKSLKKAEEEADLYNQVSLCYSYLGKHDLRISYNLKAVRIYEKLGNLSKIGKTYTNLGYSLKTTDSKQAKEYMKKGIKLLEKEKDFVTLNAAYDNYGVILEIDGKVDSAIYYYNKALDLKRNQKDSIGIPYALGHLSSAYIFKENYPKAKEYLDEAYEIRLARKDENGIAENMVLFAELYYAQENYAKALPWFLQSYEKATKINFPHLAQFASQFAAECYEKLGDNKNAIKYLKIYHDIQNSILNEATNKSIAELEIQFETEKKEKKLARQQETIAKQELKEKKRNYLIVGLSVLLLSIILVGRYLLKQQKYKQKKLIEENRLKDEIAKIRLENELYEERTRISKDLHDNIGSQLTFIISSVDNMSYLFKSGDEKLKEKLLGVSNFSKTTINQLRDTVWALNQDEISFDDLKTRLQRHMEMARSAQNEMELYFEVDVQHPIKFNAVEGVNIYRIVQEAVNNALKYSKATTLEIRFKEVNQGLELSVIDNGVGFERSTIESGNGLENMESRAKSIHAQFIFTTAPNQGTQIKILIPINT